MVMECGAILAVLAVIGVTMRQKSGAFGPLVLLPLYAMPSVYLISLSVARYLPLDGTGVRLFFLISYLLGLTVSCMVIGVMGRVFHRSRSRKAYYLLCGSFNLILAVLFIQEMIP